MLPRLERQNTTKKENLFTQNWLKLHVPNNQTLENIISEHLDLHVCMHMKGAT